MDTIPDELVIHIWSFLTCNGKSWKTIPLVCKHWYKLSNDRLCTSGDCTLEQSVMRAIIHGDAHLLQHIWDDETLDVSALISGQWFTELILNIADMNTVNRIFRDGRISPELDMAHVMHRACRVGRTDVVTLLLCKYNVVADVHAFTEACRCLEDCRIEGPFSRLLCERNISDLLCDPLLADCLILHHHHRVIRWLLYWEAAFCTPNVLVRIFEYCITTRDINKDSVMGKGCYNVATAVVSHPKCPWGMIKASYIRNVSTFGWSTVLRYMIIYLTNMMDGPETDLQRESTLCIVFDNVVIYGHAKSVAIVHNECALRDTEYARAFRRAILLAPKKKVKRVCWALLKTGRIDLCCASQGRASRNDPWLCIMEMRYWTLLDDLLSQKTYPIAPFAGGRDMVRYIMSTCPPRGLCATLKERNRVGNILAQLVQRNDFTASHDTMLRVILYAKQIKHDTLVNALVYTQPAQKVMSGLIGTARRGARLKSSQSRKRRRNP